MLCPKCGQEIHDRSAKCEYCGAELRPAEPGQKPENVVAGIVGAFIGSLIGGASIILFDQLGYVAALSGLILAICTLKGYELLGGRLSKKGIFVSILLMLVIPYIANQVSTAIFFVSYAKGNSEMISFAEAFAAVPQLISEYGYDTGAYNYTLDSDSYYTSLMMIYGFAVLGAFSTVRSVFKKK